MFSVAFITVAFEIIPVKECKNVLSKKKTFYVVVKLSSEICKKCIFLSIFIL